MRKTAKPADICLPSALGAINQLPRLEFIALAPDGLNAPVLLSVRILDLLSDTLDVDIDRTGFSVEVVSPNVLKELLSCEYSVRIGCKEEQKFKFLGRHIDLVAVYAYNVTDLINGETGI